MLLVWDFYREVSGASEVGAVEHYYDEESQSLYLNATGGLATQVAEVDNGHWVDSIPGNERIITDDTFEAIRLDHPSNGVLYFAATDGSSLTFLRYVYGMELSNLMESWSYMAQSDNAIAQFSGAVQNVGPDIFTFDATLFQPGARIILNVMMGNSQGYPIGVSWLDECNYDIASETVDISGRNSIGYFLKDQTFDDETTWEDGASTTAEAIFAYGGITKRQVQPSTHVAKFIFEPSDTLLDGINMMSSYYNSKTQLWKLLELPDGTVCLGYENWLATFMPNTIYSFNESSDVFKRKTNKLSDSSFTSIRATGSYRDVDDEEVALIPVTVQVNNFPYWALGAHRTKHLTAPNGLTQEGLQEWAEAQAEKYQYIGIGEEFVGPFRPQLIVGDIAEVVNGEEGTSLGLITDVRQVFSRKDGFKTEFSVDSGGVVTDGANYVIYSRAAEVSGFNRRQRVVDLVRFIAKK